MSGVGETVQAVVTGGVGAAVLYVSQLVLQWRKQSSDKESAKETAGLEIKKHRDLLTVELLEQARAELALARSEIKALRSEIETRDDELARLRRVEWRLSAYEEAIGIIEALVLADMNGGREAAENAARVFLARMEALKLKMGDEAQAEQVDRARQQIGRKGKDQ